MIAKTQMQSIASVPHRGQIRWHEETDEEEEKRIEISPGDIAHALVSTGADARGRGA